jgi:proteasome lid subunit RPN8/RPN11
LKVLVDPLVRSKLERLCDAKWPEEVGGELLGRVADGNIYILDCLPVPNVSTRPRDRYLPYEGTRYFLPLFLKTTGLEHVGSWHSHCDGTIPSEKDMITCPGVHMWIVHHQNGHHTYFASKNYVHVEVELLNETPRLRGCTFKAGRLILGEVGVNESGKIVGDGTSLMMWCLPEQTRAAYVVALKCRGDSPDVPIQNIASELGVSVRTARGWLKPAAGLVELRRGFARLKT